MEILTENGFKPFNGFIDRGVRKCVEIEFDNGKTLVCTLDHQLRMMDLVDGSEEFVEAQFLSIGDVLYGGITIIRITLLNDPICVVDALEVETTHSYMSNGVISHNCNLLALDEFAFLPSGLADEFIASVFPTISSSSESKMIIVSTPNGVGNAFYKLWKEAEDGTNGFNAVRGYWEELHSKEWAEEQRRMLGDVKYTAEVECVSGDTMVTVKDKETGEIKKMNMLELYDATNK